MIARKIFASVILLINFTFNSSAKEKTVTVSDLEEKEYALDPNAEAVILEQRKKVYYEFLNQQSTFMVVTEYYKRIKIYKKEALPWGIHYIFLEKASGDDEEIASVKGKTYTLDNGKIVEYKLNKEGIFKENYSDRLDRIKLSLPNVTEGSIIEFSYKIRSPFFAYIRPTHLQESIPIKEMSLSFEIPEFYKFNTDLRQGDLTINLVKTSSADKITFQSTNRGSGFNTTRTNYSSHDVDFRLNNYDIKQMNIPAYKKEPFVDNVRNYTATLEFFLKAIQYPNSAPRNYAYTWTDVIKKNKDHSAFKGEAAKANYYKNDLEEILAKGGTEKQRAIRIYNFVKNKIRWNEIYSSKAYRGVTNAYKSNVGSSGQINTILYSMLKKADINVEPIFVISIKNTPSIFPNNYAFDYLIVEATLNDGEKILFDATDKNGAPNILPNRVIKGFAKKINAGNRTIDLDLRPKKPSNNTKMLVYSIDEDGVVTGSVKSSLDRYAAYINRNDADKDDEKRLENIKEYFSLEEVENYKRENFTEIDKKLKESFSFEEENLVTYTDDEIYFHPLLFFRKKENPLKQDKRAYPLDWGANLSRKFIVNVTIPENYEVASLPQEMAIALPNNKGVFTYAIKQLGNKIMVTAKEELNTGFFVAPEYPILKQFYKQLVDKQNEQIVLKKI